MTEESLTEPTPAPRSDAPAASSAAGRGRALLGLLLAAFVVIHVGAQAAALGGAEAWERVAGALEHGAPITFAVVFLVLAPLAAHAVSGIALVRDRGAAETEAAAGRYGGARPLRAQAWAGALVAVFVVLHGAALAGPRAFLGLPAQASYDLLVAHLSRTVLGLPLAALGTIAGVGVTAFHLGSGLFAASRRFAFGAPRTMRFVTTGLAIALFALATTTVVAVATGASPFTPAPAPAPACGPGSVPPNAATP